MEDVNPEAIDAMLRSWVGVTRSFPFDEKTLVYKVCGKISALFNLDEFKGVTLKCDPQRSIDLREKYDGVNPGYHANKVHWNTVTPNTDVKTSLFLELLKHSYDLVYTSLAKKVKLELGI